MRFNSLLTIALVSFAARSGAAPPPDSLLLNRWAVVRDTVLMSRYGGMGAGSALRRGPQANGLGAHFEPNGAIESPRSAGSTASGPIANPQLWGTDDKVLSFARSGNTLYIAGSFRSVGENSGGLVPCAAEAGTALKPFPKVAGSVYVVTPDGRGGWFIGGDFTAVAGQPRFGLAQIGADGKLQNWSPAVTGSPSYIDPPAVRAIATLDGRVYVGGAFRMVGGVPRENLACVDSATGAVLNWNPGTHVGGAVVALAVHDSTIIVGGGFTSIGGVARSYLAGVDAATASVRPWAPNPSYAVHDLLVNADTLYVAGQFGGIADSLRRYVAALDLHTGRLLPFNATVRGLFVQYTPNPQISALALAGDTLYIGGNFIQVGGQPHLSVAAVNATTGAVFDWVPDPVDRLDGYPPPPIETLAISGNALFMGGWFDSLGTEVRHFAGALSRTTGAVLPWNPNPNLAPYALAAAGDTVLVGGLFGSVGNWRHRAGLAAIDLPTGTLKPWNPNPDGLLCTALAVGGGQVFVSGDFVHIGGLPQPRQFLAALDTINGEVATWNPGANDVANTLLMEGDTLYAAGYFTQVARQTRNYVAALSASTGALLGWDPDAGYPVYALERRGPTMYLGGLFQTVGGQGHRGLAAVDAATGAVLPWHCDTDNSTVTSLLVNGNTIYVGGSFGLIGGQARYAIAAIDAGTGEVLPWYPQPSGWGAVARVRAFVLLDGTLYVGGDFGAMGGQPRIGLAAVDTATALATDWDPGLDGSVWALDGQPNGFFVGGGFARAGGLPASGLAEFSIPIPPVRPSNVELSGVVPNPLQQAGTIYYALPADQFVSLQIFDLQGRRVASLFDHAFQGAGQHAVSLAVRGWREGFYFCRLEAAGHVKTRKFVVLR